MRRANYFSAALLIGACVWSAASTAQMDLSSIKIVEPSPELPGDRLLSCAKIAEEMHEIMTRRDMKKNVASSRSKICSSKKVLDKQGAEKKALSTAQTPALITASVVGGPAANAILKTTQAQDAALEAKQRPGRDRALAGMGSGIGDMLGVMNDPRLMRLGLLAQDKQCAETMAPPQKPQPAPEGAGCDGVAEAPEVARQVTPTGAPDPFVKHSATPAKPAAADPFAQR
jgi:hypothetical protein